MALRLLTAVAPAVQAVKPVQKVKVETAPVLVLSQAEILATEYIALHKKLETIDGKNLIKQMEALKKSLQTIANETMDAKKPAVFKCADGEVEFSERGTETEVDNPMKLVYHLIQKFNAPVAYSVINVALGPLRKILSEMEMKKFTTEKPGSRTLKAVRPA